MDITTIDQASLEAAMEARVRSFVDHRTTGPAVVSRPPSLEGRPHTHESSAVPQGTGLWRGPMNPLFHVRQPQISQSEAGEILRFFRGVYQGDGQDQKVALQRLGAARASQTVSEDSAGGIFVPEQFMDEVIIEIPRFTPFANAAIIRIVPMTSDTLKWPKVTTKPSAPTVIAEEGAYGKSRALFGFVELVARKIGQIIPMTEEILEGSSIDMVSLLSELVAEQLANKRNALVTNGTGAGEPEGVRQNSGVATSAYDDTDDKMEADSLIRFFHAVASQYRGDAIWLIHDSVIEILRKLADSNDRYLWTDGFAAAPALILGRPVFENPDIPITINGDESEILFGNFRRGYALGVRSGLFVDRNSSGEDWEADIVNFKFRERYDGKVTDASAFIRGTGVK